MLQQGQVDADQRQRALEVMERNARLLAQLIDDLLDVSRIVSGKLRLDVQPLDLEPVVEAATESVRAMADARRVRLEITCENAPCVVRAVSAGQALDLLGRWSPDVLVSDIEMPGDDGYALMRCVRANPRRALPAIALTAHARAEDRARAFEAAFSATWRSPAIRRSWSRRWPC